MRRRRMIWLLLLLGTVALASAPEKQPEAQGVPEPAPLVVAPQHTVTGSWQPLELEPVDPDQVPSLIQIQRGEDVCADATDFTFPFGDQTVTNDMTLDPSDPDLSCTWGTPSSPRGYRSVWYRFTPLSSGFVTIETTGSTYDTILAVYTTPGNDCSQISQSAQVTCNDDSSGFVSRVSLSALAGRTYFVEVADWHLGVSGNATLNISALIERPSNWTVVGPMATGRSRHASVVVGENIYVIGGQTVLIGNPVRSPLTEVYRTTAPANQHWTTLANMPGPDGLGYSNTTAAYVEGKIYLPAGYIGVDGTYDGTHWVYDIAGNAWSSAPSDNNWADGEPAIYSASASATCTGRSAYYVIGGLTGVLPIAGQTSGWEARSEMYCYVPSRDQWFLEPTPMNTGRFGHSAGLLPINGVDHICVVGGISKGSVGPAVEGSGECFNLNTRQWGVNNGNLNYPRYNAGSAVDPAGNWYIFGGTNAAGGSVAVTERFDAAARTWIALDVRFDLGTSDPAQPSRPARAWPRGGFVGQALWAIGGHRNSRAGDFVINLVERIHLPHRRLYLPVVFQGGGAVSGEPDDTLEDARPLGFNAPQLHRFYSPDDVFDAFYFDVGAPRTATVILDQIGLGNDYDLAVYSDNKVLLGSSNHVGAADEVVVLSSLSQGRYYILVERVFPPQGADPSQQPFRIEVRG